MKYVKPCFRATLPDEHLKSSVIGTTNCEPQLDVIQKRSNFMYQTVVKNLIVSLPLFSIITL